ncbi:MAG: adenosylmethionine decarboxylase [Pseudomonadota bacterium]
MASSVPPLGVHLIAEFYGCSGLDDAEFVRNEMIEAATASGATVLRADVHNFGDGFGVTGVVLLAESHISIHTWPEYHYAAIDVFVCGDRANPQTAVDYLQGSFKAARVEIAKCTRGSILVSAASEGA